ncbi:MAG: hypothetical protein HKO02_13215 [Hyphomonadaceae bacterium]|nr:hypothetical protein [Hyphomonadaceae bacterium]
MKNFRRSRLPPPVKWLCVFWALMCSLGLSACGAADKTLTPTFHAEGNPPLLSDWGVVGITGGELALGSDVLAYDLNTPLFTDYAHKLRTVWMPAGTSATYHPTDSFEFPVGTIISKTFYYPKGETAGEVLKSEIVEPAPLDLSKYRLIETRILANRAEGWVALPYVWDADQSEAHLKRIGDIKHLTLVSDAGAENFPYVVPNANQCAGCHATNATTKQLLPIGPKARHLNKNYGANEVGQLEAWQAAGYLNESLKNEAEIQKAAVWNDPDYSLDARARSYLDINCAHCHNKVGPADTSGLHFEPETETGVHLGLCKSPIAAGSGTGGRPFDIVPGDPESSITVYRMQATDPSEMMPELGRSLAHAEGVELIREWVTGLEGDCG